MIDAADQFHTAVSGVFVTWPTAPKRWSYSSLNDAETCPRRWMLSRGSYGDLWDGIGYPPRPSLPALMGNVIHASLELILTAFQVRACVSIAEPCAVEAIREIGGYTKLIERTMADELEALERNPRADGCIVALRTQLRKELPNMRERVQMAISRTQLVEAGGEDVGTGSTASSKGLAPGSYTEVALRVDELRLIGRADLLTVDTRACTITDYKSGAPNEQHAEQLRLYALLWSRDRKINPHLMPIERLVVAYATQDEVLDPPSDAELENLAGQITDRITKVEQELQVRPPPAYPAAEVCCHCSVRHLCDDYWVALRSGLASDDSSVSTRAVDCEVVIVEQKGPRSWNVDPKGESRSALLRTPTEAPGFSVGETVRLLGILADVGEEEGEGPPTPILTMTQFSEVFVLGNGG